MDNNIDTLNELHKGCCMGIDAIDFIINKINEEEFNKILIEQKNDYEKLSKKIEKKYNQYTTKDIHETNIMTKAMTWYGIQMDTMLDNSISKIADILIKGTNMGIIEGKKLINNKTMSKDVLKLCNDYINMQEKNLNILKEYL